ncbi:hypothetical protein M2451_003783 [Dysgonomonas sp. PFB1-18]|uniref:hypothetical protein n=1 Tax=unclassified Dysgonomonas TaxID=2630389 RepID=UPI002473BFE5|nr:MULTISPECIES: hypothetical protein [unclassified Dysgonomonas]MDH6310919.1 hypothetical protein [Dysgonomonas sp. PF1-14]MDH6340866.1 hypothetical protein [Dysgonomonas sp. PF1-16]MDH6382442.1 hypothetical protein [Dysgonomonas sp. PFB1-18]MDH6399791.1 hypothetical protein [Dysgonomonas sp. PF1-23]
METVVVQKTKNKLLRDVHTVLNVYFPHQDFKIDINTAGNYDEITISYTDGATNIRVKNALKHLERPPVSDIRIRGIRIKVERSMSEKAKNLILNETMTVFRLDSIPSDNEYFEPMKGVFRKYIDAIFKIREF